MADVSGAELRNMSKRSGQVLALSDASLLLRRREVHVLAGEWIWQDDADEHAGWPPISRTPAPSG